MLEGEESLGVCLSRAHHAFVAFLDGQLERCGLAGDLRPGMGHALYQLLRKDDLTLTEISNRARLAQSTMTDVVAQMESSGLVERRRDERDRRAYRVRLTAKARALRPRLEELDRRLGRAYAAQLSASDLATLKQLLNRLLAAISVQAPAGIESTPDRDARPRSMRLVGVRRPGP